MTQQLFNTAIELIDAANNEDPNIETSEGKDWCKESLYAHRMSDMLQRYLPDSDDAVKLAVYGQHIQRWKSPRTDFPMDRKGYHQWRTALYTFHAETTATFLAQAGYDDAFIERVKLAIGKKSLKTNTDTQTLEDVAALVFIEHYMQAFVDKHPEYDEEKWLFIVVRTLKKMTAQAHQFALTGNIKLPEPLIPLIKKAVASL
ncbi:MAG: hypothetical protein COA54_13890 [Thiotrichaceae bacterium]|nr:MAG: hypothetical protein COA54_13890 [Thiotrichaceae bacterium]